MSTPFKMKGFSGFVNSPIKQNNKQANLKRQTKIQTKVQNAEANNRRRKKNSIYELGYFQDDDGKMVYPFGKRKKMDKAKWNKWKSDPDNKPYKGKTKGLL